MTRLSTKNYKGMSINEVKAIFKKERNINARAFKKGYDEINEMDCYTVNYGMDYDTTKTVYFTVDENDVVTKVTTCKW